MTDGIIPTPLRQLPWSLLLLLVALGGFGAVILYSAAGGSLTPWAASHAIRFGIFLMLAIAMSRIPESWYAQLAFPGYVMVLLLLIGVELLGAISGGSQRWLDLGFIRLQPSELMKLVIVLATARYYARLPGSALRTWTGIWPMLVLAGLPFALVMLQPDLGTATMIAVGGVTVMFLAGVPLRLFVGSGIAFASVLPIIFSMLHDYQKKRVLIFLNPEEDALGAGYHITQSKIAIGSGGLFGKGFLNGTQSHLDYLPEGHTDFVFATMAEEWGLLGGLAVIVAFVLVGRWGLNVANRATTRFGKLTAAGLSMTIFYYVTINLLMVMGLAPVVGIPLPLVSHGGTAMLTVMLCLGIMMSIDRNSRIRGSL
ncbi:MAG: rod shape-determining protein RodA [Sphingomonadaceae bacterium]|jgi:rod shape determining protein RodA|nr:rod shape-determining protein RodA [Sphingomonadaceae bacterium]